MEREEATIALTDIRLLDGANPVIEGHAAVFNQRSSDMGFIEYILPGAFSDAVKTDDVKFLLNHRGLPLARTKSGTLRIGEDQKGLAFRAELDASDPDVQRIIPKIRRRDLSEMSFGFGIRSREDERWFLDGEKRMRELNKVALYDISAVAFPAYPSTDLSVRSELRSYFAAKMAELRDLPLVESAESKESAEKLKAEFEARAKARRELIARLTPPPDKNSLTEILKRCRIE